MDLKMKTCGYCDTDLTRGVYCPKCGMKNSAPMAVTMVGLRSFFWLGMIGGAAIFLCFVLSYIGVL